MKKRQKIRKEKRINKKKEKLTEKVKKKRKIHAFNFKKNMNGGIGTNIKRKVKWN